MIWADLDFFFFFLLFSRKVSNSYPDVHVHVGLILKSCFCFCVQIGSFFMINLCLVVIATQFSETKQREHQLMQEQRARCLSSSTLASLTEPGDCYEELFQLVCHVLRKARRRSVALYYTLRGKVPPPGGGRSRRRGGVKANGGKKRQCRSTQGVYFICI